MYKIMTAGPVQVRENVLAARSIPCTNPDQDVEFYEFYKETCDLFSEALHTENRAIIMGGEGILGLEAACASLTEPGDRVLVIDNGIFGKGFADFVKIYGGEPVLYTTDYKNPVDPAGLEAYLEKDSDFRYATLVHCDTPSGVINDIPALTNILDKFGVLSVVDSVAGMFGQPLDCAKSKIDILCGGSQKALSAPPGLTMVWVSQRAFDFMEHRKTPIASFYANIMTFKDYYENKWFPYTMPISDITGLRQALDNFMADDSVYDRHAKIAAATRYALVKGGLSLYLESGYSNTVTVLEVPEGITDKEILEGMMQDYNIMISGCFDVLAGKVIRIGHMGENANAEDVAATLAALQGTLEKHGIKVACDLAKEFKNTYENGAA